MKKATRDKLTFYLVVAVFGYLILGGIGLVPLPGKTTGEVAAPSQPSGAIVTTTCDPATGQPVKVAVANDQNKSEEYLGNTLYLMRDGQIIDTGTATAGSTISYTTLDAKCTDRNVRVIANPSASLIGTATDVTLDGTGAEVILPGAKSAIPAVTIYDVDKTTNLSTTADTDGTVTYTSAVSLGEQQTEKGYILLTMTTSASQFGGIRNGKAILVGWKNPDTTVFDNEDVKLSVSEGGYTLTSVDCGKYPNAKDAYDLDRCWVLDKAIGSRDKTSTNAISDELWIYYTVRPSKGDPGATDDVTIYFVDLHEFYDSVSKSVIFDGADANNNDIGETNVQVTIDLS